MRTAILQTERMSVSTSFAGGGKFALGWAFASLLASSGAWALPDEARTEQVRARLVASVNAVYPGAEILLGVNQRIIPHWHTYWKNPGDSGLPTRIDWRLPQNAVAGDILWPVPGRFTLGPVTNYAYADEVTLLSPVKVADDVRPGSLFSVEAKVKWLVCEEICIPQQVELGLTLPVVADRQAAGPGSPLVREAHATMPEESPWPASVDYGQDEITLRLAGGELNAGSIADISFFPDRWGRIDHGAPQVRVGGEREISLKLRPGEEPGTGAEPLSGVLVITENTPDGPVRRGFQLEARPVSATGNQPVPGGMTVAGALGFALLGGLILNLMPCVFPILSLKALHLLKQSGVSRRTVRLQGLAYTGGVLMSFALLGAVLIALKSTGAKLGWGFQFQSPAFVLAVAFLMFTVGLSLSGLVNLGGSVAGLGAGYAEKPGYAGSFFTGVLAAVVAAPCTAPFMGAAVGYALSQPPPVLLAVLIALGLGLALPYLALSFSPALQRWLPRPGAWMETLKQGLAFPMYATAAWLVWVLARQTGTSALPLALGGILAIAFAAWLRDRTRRQPPAARQLATGIAALVLWVPMAAIYFVHAGALSGEPKQQAVSGNWESYAPQRLQTLRAQGKPVFLNLTADWCISCLVNERVALNADEVTKAFRAAGVTYLKGDWTNRDPLITAKLAEFHRSGVPLYVHYPAGAGSAPVVLPQILTPQIVLSAIGGGGYTDVRHSR